MFSIPINCQAEAFTNILFDAISQFVIKETDQPWNNSYTRLLLHKKNRNYQFYKKSNNQYLSFMDSLNNNPETVTCFNKKKNKAFQKSKSSDKESFNANRRAKQAFFNSINSTMKKK